MAHRQAGFTLVELLVSLAIFAVLGLASWQTLDRVIATKATLDQRADQLHRLQRGLWLLARDLRAATNRPVRDNLGIPESAFTSLIPSYNLVFTRLGWPNPGGERRGTLQRVAYSLEADDHGRKQLVRYYWPVLDRAPNTAPKRQVLVTGVNFLELRFIDVRGRTEFYWPPARHDREDFSQSPIPSGVQITLDIAALGAIERVFSLRDIEPPMP